MARHELEPGQTQLSCAIDQRHEVIVPDWSLQEFEDEAIDDGVSPQTLATQRTGWKPLPGFPPEDRPLTKQEGSGEWDLDHIGHEGDDFEEDQG